MQQNCKTKHKKSEREEGNSSTRGTSVLDSEQNKRERTRVLHGGLHNLLNFIFGTYRFRIGFDRDLNFFFFFFSIHYRETLKVRVERKTESHRGPRGRE